MKKLIKRRSVLKAAAIGTGYWAAGQIRPARAQSANEKLNVAVIGVGGRGRANLDAMAHENIVSLCDVDAKRAGNAFEKYPKAKRFADFRQMFDQMGRLIDAVVISTPDHTHFFPAMIAMQLGKHCYCEKPMAHTVTESRRMTDIAREGNLATQLGVQRHTMDNVHRVVEVIRAGAIGTVTDVYSWITGDRGMPPAPTSFPPVPAHLDWDLWLGPASFRPYSPEYCPYKWRFWWDFGTGETGNWGCHILDIPFWALDLKYPNHVSASGPPVHERTSPKSMATQFQFPARGSRPPVTLHWDHAKDGPEILRQLNLPHKGHNTLFIGDEGMLLCGFGRYKLYPEEKFSDYQPPDKWIPDSPGFHQEWINACKGGPPATCDFNYAGPLAETVLLGNAAYRAGERFGWDAASLTAHGSPRVAQYLDKQYRAGWEVPF